MNPADVMNQSGARKSVLPIAIRAAPAAFVTLVGVFLGLVFQTNPVQEGIYGPLVSPRPYSDGAWVPSDLIGLFIVGLVVGVLNRSFSGLVGTIVGASAAVAIQLFVLTEQASWTTNVVASLREPAWSRQVLGALALGSASLIGGYVAGAFAGLAPAAVRSGGAAMRPSAAFIRHGVIAGLTLAGSIFLALVLVRAAATSAFVPSESEPVLQVTVQGDRISSVTPETIAAGRLTIDIQRTAGIKERWVSVEGLTDDMEAVLLAGNDPQQYGGGLSRPFPATQDLVRIATRTELSPGRFAVIVSDGMAEMGPDDTAFPEVPALDVRKFVVTGPVPASSLAATGGPLLAIGYQLSLAVTGWATAGSLLVVRRGRNRAAAVMAGLVAAGLMWLLVGFTIHQSYAPL